MEEEKVILQETTQQESVQENDKDTLEVNVLENQETFFVEQPIQQANFTFIPAKEEKKAKNKNMLFSSSIICSIWGILLCLVQPFGIICACIGLGLFLSGINKKKTTSYKWALSISIISLIVTVIFCIIL